MTQNNSKGWLRSFFVRTLFSHIIVIVLVFVLIYVFSQAPIHSFYIDKLKNRLTQVGYAFTPKAIELFENDQLTELDKLVKELGKSTDIRLTVIKPDGVVVADSQSDPLQMENHGHRPEILAAIKGEIGDSSRFSNTMGEQMFYLALPVAKAGGETALIMRLSVYFSEIKQLMSQLKWNFATILLLLFILSLFIAGYFSSSISRPVQSIMEAMKKFSNGDFDTRVFLEKKGELSEMAESFNKMAEEQKNMFQKLRDRESELRAIISAMKEGLMVIDGEGKIILCNQSFRDMVGKPCGTGTVYWEALRIPDFDEHVKMAFKGDVQSYEKVEISNRTFLVGFNPMENGEKLVIIFRDITDFHKLETMKKDFVVNLTHELKTPLTAIKGFMETLEEEENFQHPEYVEIIKRHTSRMTQIVSDLLVLSELEKMQEDKNRIHFEPLNLYELIDQILVIYKEKIKEKKLRLEVDVPEDLPPVPSERFKLEQMFINLLDNALKYTDQENGEIVIRAHGPVKGNGEDEKNKTFVDISIENNGSPIPQKSLSRIFERFYVVDKSRSRKMGGTGLGLSIVKHVVLLHKGKISVQSNKEKTVFSIRLPL